MFIQKPFSLTTSTGGGAGWVPKGAIVLDDQQYFSRTPGSAGNRTTWTYSLWIKRNQTNPINYSQYPSAGPNASAFMLSVLNTSSAPNFRFVGSDSTGGNNRIRVSDDVGATLFDTGAEFSDVSGWYHIVFSFDSTQPLQDNRLRLFVNGQRVADYGLYNAGNLTLNEEWAVNNTVQHNIGKSAVADYLYATISEVIMLDGYAALPSELGQYNSNGIWIPIDPSTIVAAQKGTNGFWLDFADSSDLGNDVSGNNNDFTATSITSANATLDNPSDSGSKSNYCTWDSNNRQVPNGNDIILSNGNLQLLKGSGSSNPSIKSTLPFHGKQYVEMRMIANSSAVGSRQNIGIIEYNANLETGFTPSSNATFSGVVFPRLQGWSDGVAGTIGADLTNGQTVCVAFSEDDQKWWYRVNDGSWIGGGDPTVPSSTPSGTFTSGKTYLWSGFVSDTNDENITDFGQNGYAYTPPSGYLPVNTINMTTPTITDPSLHFSGIGYTGNGLGQRVGGFLPFTNSFKVANSARFDAPTDYITYDNTSGHTNSAKGTISVWMKSSNLLNISGTVGGVFSFNGDKFRAYISKTTGQMQIEAYEGGGAAGPAQVIPRPYFTGQSSWNHFVFQMDYTGSGSASSANFKFYFNGLEVELSTANYGTLGGTPFAGTMILGAGFNSPVTNFLFDGYMAEYIYVDGSIIAPSVFGETDTSTNRWIPKDPTTTLSSAGSFGNNGFYYDFASGTALGNDVSGNNNDGTPTGFDSTNGSNQMYDTPTQNFPTYNRDSVFSDSSLTEGNTTVKLVTANADNCSIIQAPLPSTGVHYWEVLALNTGSMYFGVSYNDNTLSASGFDQSWLIGMNGQRYDPFTGSGTALFTALSAGDMIGMAYNGNLKALYYSINGAWMDAAGSLGNSATVKAEIEAGTATTNAIFIGVSQPALIGTNNITATSILMPAVLDTSYGAMTTLGSNANMGAWRYLDSGALTYTSTADGYFQSTTIPTNAKALSQPNLESSSSGVTALNLIKSTSAATDNFISDRLTGPNQFMTTKGPTASQQSATTGGVQTFLQDGVQIGAYGDVNTDDALYNSFSWAGGGAGATSSPAGTIASTVTVNTTAGFSVITYTGTGSAGTIGHGLGVAPACIWVAMRSNAYGWAIYHQELGNTSFIRPFKPDAVVTGSTFWNSTTPIANTFSVGTDATVNESSSTFVAFAFTEIEGYSKFGSYIGNGNADGPFIYCGFQPELVIYKNSSAASTDWRQSSVVDYPNNPVTNCVFPNLASAASAGAIEIYSSGFKISNSSSAASGDGNTMIFMAWAKHPFGGSDFGQSRAR